MGSGIVASDNDNNLVDEAQRQMKDSLQQCRSMVSDYRSIIGRGTAEVSAANDGVEPVIDDPGGSTGAPQG